MPVDPDYLSWKMKTLNYQVRAVDLATQINTQMPYYVADKLKIDCAAIITDHSRYDYDWIVQSSKLILDTRNATKM